VIADLHCHYAMHLLERVERPRLRQAARRGIPLRDRLRAVVMWIANRLGNYPGFFSGRRVDLDKLERGGVKLVCSVLYVPFSELDLGQPYAAPPLPRYVDDLCEQLERVEQDLGDRAKVARGAGDLADPRIVFVHCVEGGFALGATPDAIDRNVARLARCGVLYVTLAHLFFRQMATNANALPFLSDRCYDRLFPQPAETGLTRLGEAAVCAMAREKVLVDLSHMRETALHQTLDRLDRAAPGFPVIASHAGARFPRSTQHYQLGDEALRRIGARGGVVGLIMAQHQLNDGIRRTRTHTLGQTVDVMCRHIDRVAELAGPGSVALGTDFDGFIKPTMGGLRTAADLARLREPLLKRYDAGQVDAFLYGNAHRLVERVLAARTA
jgi:microsomal dipeptidase-like Zn-dependent dipeptidase